MYQRESGGGFGGVWLVSQRINGLETKEEAACSCSSQQNDCAGGVCIVFVEAFVLLERISPARDRGTKATSKERVSRACC